MNQKQNSSIQEKAKNLQQKNSFKQTIKRIEFNSFKQEYSKRKLISVRNKLRDQWLQRIKIVPPKLSVLEKQNFFRATDSFSNKQNLCFNIFKHDFNKKDPFVDDLELLFQKQTFQTLAVGPNLSRESLKQRNSYCTMTNGLTKARMDAVRARKLKQNWKLAYRKDEINVLRFSTNTPKQPKMIEIPRFPSGIGQHELKIQIPTKILYKKMVLFEESNQQNTEEKEKMQQERQQQDKKQEKKYRFNAKRGKTSLILKRPLLL